MEINKLSEGKCEPCSGNTPKLDYIDITKYLSQLNEWSVNDNQEMIFKKFKSTVKTFESLGFAINLD